MNNDTIYRQDAIDALAYFNEQSPTGLTAQEVIKGLPSVQPEIIRCKDCKFANSLKIGIVCRNMSRSVTENDFCSRAERRTDE